MINNDEIELFLSQLNATLKDYYGNNSDYVNVPNDICNLVREGIKISLIIIMVPIDRIELSSEAYHAPVLPLY